VKEKPLEKKNTTRIRVEGVKKVYGKKVAVKTMSFSMDQGEIVGLLGPNGAGKTTCFYMIAGFIKATAGKILLDGRDITHEPMYRRSRLGISYLPQEPSVFRKLTVEENIWAILETRKDIKKQEKQDKMEKLIEDLGVQKVRKQKAFTLSGGERRRTEIARSLATDPRFLLLDEPFAGIDPIAIYEIKRIIEHLSDRGIGILITDHNVRDTFEITHRSYITSLGEIIVSGSKEELLESKLARKIYLGQDFSM
jgi:lipopolysaccharide export system ATP-binding protein